ncbi:MAG: ferredoxin [Actinomycetota bacterium]|nr:ferredoxin [Actinomycetota bacterium]
MAGIPTTYSATVSHDLCVGVGMCLQHAPGAFEFGDDGLSVFRPDGGWTD